jgi:formylglycine-generating enzyme required for sulfatase activity
MYEQELPMFANESVISQFEDAWNTGSRPSLDAYAASLDAETTRALAQVDLERRLKAGLSARAGDYLRFEAVRQDSEFLLTLMRDEFRFRRRGREPELSPDRFIGQYPEWADRLAGTLPLEDKPSSINNPTPPTKPVPAHWPKIEGYEITRMLGGNMGQVYLAREVALDRAVAVKVLSGGVHATAEQRRRFLAEIQSLARLQHSNIVRVFSQGELDGALYFTMEYEPGGTLVNWTAGRPQPARVAAQTIEILALALQHAHEHQIVHRDVKPANVLMDESGRPKLTDFGLAKLLDTDGSGSQTGEALGTPSFMAPEQAAGKVREVDGRTDVYGLGAVLYWMLTGRPPFEGSNGEETRLLVLTADLIAPSQLRRGLARDLETICLKCLNRERDKRYATAQALAEDLQRFLCGESVLARRPGLAEQTWRWVCKWPTVTGVVIASCIALAIILWIRWSNLADQELARVQQNVAGLQHAAPDAVPVWLELLGQNPQTAVGFLRRTFDELPVGPERNRLAYGLALLGEPDVDYLVQTVLPTLQVTPSELRQWLVAAKAALPQSIQATRQAFRSTTDLDLRARYAIAAVHLGEPEPAREMLNLVPDESKFAEYTQIFQSYRISANARDFAGAIGDPKPRTTFISRYLDWHGDPLELLPIIDANLDSALRSGLVTCLALLGKQKLSSEIREKLRPELERLYTDSPDAGTHAAARYALQNLDYPLPVIEARQQPKNTQRWYVDRFGQTMIYVEPTSYMAGGRFDDYELDHYPHAIHMKRPFFLADREVSLDLYRQFLADTKYTGPKPKAPGREPNPDISPTPKHPVQRISWLDAVYFCNWLSFRESRMPAYLILLNDNLGRPLREPIIKAMFYGNGYRLPTQAEWEYCARAGTHTRYAIGDDESSVLFSEMVTTSAIHRRPTRPVGRSLPNQWGFSDMHGNLWEYCWDLAENHAWPTIQSDPTGLVYPLAFTNRALRGGGVGNTGGLCASSAWTYKEINSDQGWNVGFRVATNVSDLGMVVGYFRDVQELNKITQAKDDQIFFSNQNNVFKNTVYEFKTSSNQPPWTDYRGTDWKFNESLLRDGNSESVWVSAPGDSVARNGKPWVEVTLKTPTAVRRVTVLGSRKLLRGGGRWFVTECQVKITDIHGQVLYENTQEGALPFHDFDWRFATPLANVHKILLTPTRDTGDLNDSGSIALAEIFLD